VSIYEDAALVEVSGTPTGEALDHVIVVRADQLEVTLRFRHETRRGMEATWKPHAPRSHPQTIGGFSGLPVFTGDSDF
jgi:hypothetical protein